MIFEKYDAKFGWYKQSTFENESAYNPRNLPAIRREVEYLPDRIILWTMERVWSFQYLALKLD